MVTRAILVPGLLIVMGLNGAGCGGAADEPESREPARKADSSQQQRLDGGAALPEEPAPDSGVPAPDQGSTPAQPPGCPALASVAGAYAGTFKGAITALFGLVTIPLSGTMTFDLVVAGSDLSIKNGKVSGVLNGTPYSFPMDGSVSCGKLAGQGIGDISGTKF